MSIKKWCISFVCIILSAAVLLAGATFLLDPLVRYRSEDDGLLTYYKRSEMYTNPGVARNYKYDSVIIGTSMMHLASVQEFNDIDGGDAVKLTYSGGTAYNMKQALDICFKSDNEIKNIYWALDDFQLISDSSTTRHPLPEYLYEEGYAGDLEYLLNGDIFFRYTAPCLINTLLGKKKTVLSLAADGYKPELYNGKIVADEFVLETQKSDSTDFLSNAEKNLEQNIIPFIESNPDTEFTFMFVPYSMLYWYREIAIGSYEECVKAVELAIQTLIEYDNVSVYYFRNDTDITTNLDNYKDHSHYSSKINSYMCKAIANGENKLTKDNYRQELDEFKKFTAEYDYEALLTKYRNDGE